MPQINERFGEVTGVDTLSADVRFPAIGQERDSERIVGPRPSSALPWITRISAIAFVHKGDSFTDRVRRGQDLPMGLRGECGHLGYTATLVRN